MSQICRKELLSNENFFESLDRDFVENVKYEDEIFTYKATDVLVQSTWELPVIVRCEHAIVTYEFSSSPSDIGFGILFVPAPTEDRYVDDLDVETVEEMERVPSHEEVIHGSFQLPAEGVVFFLWDNNHDWISNKHISYKIEVQEPTFGLCDAKRASVSLRTLRQTTEDLDVAHVRHADAQDCWHNNVANMQFLSDKIDIMQKKLEAKRQEHASLQVNIMDCYQVIHIAKEVKMGLLIRELDKNCLGAVLAFLQPVEVCAVSHHWRAVRLEHEIDRVSPWYIGKSLADLKRQMETQKRHEKVHALATIPGNLGDDIVEPVGNVSSEDSDVNVILGRKGRCRMDGLANPVIVSNNCDNKNQDPASNSRKSKDKSIRDKRREEKQLRNLKEIRDEQQQIAVVEYVSASEMKIESLAMERRRLKRLIRAWNASYEKQHGKLPTSGDRTGHLRELHEEYQQVSLALKIRQDKLDKFFKQVGMTETQYDELKHKKFKDFA